MKQLTVALLCLCAAGVLSAQTDTRYIEVESSADIMVSPDRAIVHCGVESWGTKLAAARADNDQRSARILAVAASFQIDPALVQTGYIAIEPVFAVGKESGIRSIASYQVSKTITVELRDLTKLDALLAKLLDAGANTLSGVSFETGRLRELRDQARALAAKAARDKAQAIAAELGQGLGRPLEITELADRFGFSQSQSNQLISQQSFETDQNAAATVSLGQIKVTAKLKVKFELKDR